MRFLGGVLFVLFFWAITHLGGCIQPRWHKPLVPEFEQQQVAPVAVAPVANYPTPQQTLDAQYYRNMAAIRQRRLQLLQEQLDMANNQLMSWNVELSSRQAQGIPVTQNDYARSAQLQHSVQSIIQQINDVQHGGA